MNEAKECAICGAPLPTPLDTFGDVEAPVCQSCWLEPGGDNWDLQIFIRVPLENGGSALMKGPDYDWFFAVEEKVSQ